MNSSGQGIAARVQETLDRWRAGDHTMYDECTEAPEIAWAAICSLARGELLSEENASLLGAGPVETLLAYHGKDFIDRVLKEAATNKNFNEVLDFVWQNQISEDVWLRLQSTRKL
jgi:hypothetical protein